MKRSVNFRRRGAGLGGLVETMKFVGMDEGEVGESLEKIKMYGICPHCTSPVEIGAVHKCGPISLPELPRGVGK